MQIRTLILILILAVLVTIPGCTPTNLVDAEAIAPLVEIVSDRHDAYVSADETLSAVEREVYLDSTALLRATIAEATSSQPKVAE